MSTSVDKPLEPIRQEVSRVALVAGLFVLAFFATPAWSHPPDDDHTHLEQQDSGTKHGSLGDVGAKLANPMADIWAMTMSFNGPQFFDGNLNRGDSKLGGGVNVEPVMPFPIYGTGENQWKLITRPVIPILFSQPIPTGFNQTKQRGGLGDIQLPLPGQSS